MTEQPNLGVIECEGCHTTNPPLLVIDLQTYCVQCALQEHGVKCVACGKQDTLYRYCKNDGCTGQGELCIPCANGHVCVIEREEPAEVDRSDP